MSDYDSSYFARLMPESYRSAQEIIPLLLEHYRPSSAVDVGCGVGSWAKALEECGVEDVIGIDSNYIDQNMLMIDRTHFLAVDLAQSFDLERKFDLVVSVEVAEHLPYDRASGFVRDLADLGDVILFSAALPYQAGVNHLNENWLEFWAILFMRSDFVAVDLVRPTIWYNRSISYWYRQNILVFIKKQKAQSLFPSICIEARRPLTYVHPQLFMETNWWRRSREKSWKKIEHDLSYYHDLVEAYLSGSTDVPRQRTPYQSNKDSRWASLRRKARDFLPLA
jgi:SAM-dependent methyltransferase